MGNFSKSNLCTMSLLLQLLSSEQFGMQSSSEDMAAMLGHVTTVLDHMTSKKVQHLFLMKGSQRSFQAGIFITPGVQYCTVADICKGSQRSCYTT